MLNIKVQTKQFQFFKSLKKLGPIKRSRKGGFQKEKIVLFESGKSLQLVWTEEGTDLFWTQTGPKKSLQDSINIDDWTLKCF